MEIQTSFIRTLVHIMFPSLTQEFTVVGSSRKSWPISGPLLYLYSKELLAEEVLRLRVFLLRRARLRLATSPPSQVEQQYGAASI